MSDEVIYTSMDSIIQHHRNSNEPRFNDVVNSKGSYRPSQAAVSDSAKQSETNPNVTFRRPSELAAGILY